MHSLLQPGPSDANANMRREGRPEASKGNPAARAAGTNTASRHLTAGGPAGKDMENTISNSKGWCSRTRGCLPGTQSTATTKRETPTTSDGKSGTLIPGGYSKLIKSLIFLLAPDRVNTVEDGSRRFVKNAEISLEPTSAVCVREVQQIAPAACSEMPAIWWIRPVVQLGAFCT